MNAVVIFLLSWKKKIPNCSSHLQSWNHMPFLRSVWSNSYKTACLLCFNIYKIEQSLLTIWLYANATIDWCHNLWMSVEWSIVGPWFKVCTLHIQTNDLKLYLKKEDGCYYAKNILLVCSVPFYLESLKNRNAKKNIISWVKAMLHLIIFFRDGF